MGSWSDVYIAFPTDAFKEFRNGIYELSREAFESKEKCKTVERLFTLVYKTAQRVEIERLGIEYVVLSWHDIKWFKEIPEIGFIEDFVDKHSLPYMRIIDDEVEVEKNNTLFTTYPKICVDY